MVSSCLTCCCPVVPTIIITTITITIIIVVIIASWLRPRPEYSMPGPSSCEGARDFSDLYLLLPDLMEVPVAFCPKKRQELQNCAMHHVAVSVYCPCGFKMPCEPRRCATALDKAREFRIATPGTILASRRNSFDHCIRPSPRPRPLTIVTATTTTTRMTTTPTTSTTTSTHYHYDDDYYCCCYYCYYYYHHHDDDYYYCCYCYCYLCRYSYRSCSC